MLVICVCGKIGLLQQMTPKYFRVRHTTKVPYFSKSMRRLCYHRHFTYCKVSVEWAQKKIAETKEQEMEELKKMLEEYGKTGTAKTL